MAFVKREARIQKGGGNVMMQIDTEYKSGNTGWARYVIHDGRIFIGHSPTAQTPTITIEEMKELISTYEALHPVHD